VSDGFWPEHDPRSEYEGRGVLRNGGFPKGAEALTASDKLRLQSITGQETDPLAEPDPYFWQGGVAPEPPTLPAMTEKQVLDIADPYPKGY
jgi:hypothetical protein